MVRAESLVGMEGGSAALGGAGAATGGSPWMMLLKPAINTAVKYGLWDLFGRKALDKKNKVARQMTKDAMFLGTTPAQASMLYQEKPSSEQIIIESLLNEFGQQNASGEKNPWSYLG
jgi:hypothetical protein